jgi:hypothetical protein
MICGHPPAPSPTHSYHSLSHPSIHTHQHCKTSHFRYYPFSHHQILFSASNQTLPTLPFHHPSPDHHRTTGPAHPDLYHHQDHIRVFHLYQALITRENWFGRLQCPLQPAAPPAQHNRPYLPRPPHPYPPPDETAVLVAVSAIQNLAHHNRAPAKK